MAKQPSHPSAQGQTARQYAGLAHRLKAALKPLAEPLALSFHRERPAAAAPLSSAFPPPSEAGRTGAVAAGCVFWMMAGDRTFATAPQDHANCSVGSLTHGLISFAQAAERDDVAAVLESGWVSGEQAAAIPTVRERPGAIVYGPLAEAEAVDVALLRISGLGLMTLRDALPDLQIEGKPQCHIIAIAKERQVPAASVGCALSRARTGMRAEEMTCALPGKRLAELVAALEATAELNRNMGRYAAADAKRFTGGRED